MNDPLARLKILLEQLLKLILTSYQIAVVVIFLGFLLIVGILYFFINVLSG